MARLPQTKRTQVSRGPRFRAGPVVNALGQDSSFVRSLGATQKRSFVSTDTVAEDTSTGWGMLADVTAITESVFRPLAMDALREEGRNSVYRDEEGDLRVDEMWVTAGDYAEAYNSAAHAKYLGQSRVDLRNDMTELREKHKYDPAAFQEASDELIKRVYGKAPAPIRDAIKAQAESEAGAMFDGMRRSLIVRDEKAADKSSISARKMASQDFVSLIMNGARMDDPRVLAKLQEIDEITRFRANAPYINESEAEGEAFGRALMGDAKAMRLQREIDELGGVENLKPEDRDRLTSAIRDPDISPGTQEKLHRVLNGELKRIDGMSFAKSLTSDDYWSVLERNEKGGTSDGVPRKDDGTPRSSASGRYGLLDGTFADMVEAQRRQGNAKWAEGMSRAEIIKHKGDPVKERAAAETYRAQLQSVLVKEGLPINRGNEYVMWVFGEGGGVKALRADPTTPAVNVVGAAAIEANSWEGRTMGSIVSMLRRKGGGPKSSDISGIRDQIGAIEDPEVRRVAQAEVNRWYQIKRQAEAEAAEAYALRIQTGDAVTRDEIISDPELDDGAQKSLIRSLEQVEKVTNEVSDTIADMEDPNTFVDMSDVKTRNKVDNAYAAMTGGADPLSNDGMSAAAQILDKTGSIPKAMVGALMGAISSNDPERIVTAMNFAEQATRENPGAFNVYKRDGKKLSQDVAEYRHEIRMGRGAEAAAARMAERRLPENVEKRKNRVGESKKVAEALTTDDLEDAFNDQTPVIGLAFTDPVLNPKMQDVMMSILRRETANQFVETGDADIARVRALDEVGRVFGVTNASVPPTVMMHPPERNYPAVNGDHEWLYSQLQNEVSAHVTPVAREKGEIGEEAIKVIPRENIHLQSDMETQADIEAGRPPSYIAWFRDGEKIDRMPQRWFADPTEFQKARDAENAETVAGAALGRETGMDLVWQAGVELFDFAQNAETTAEQLVSEVKRRGPEIAAEIEKQGLEFAHRGAARAKVAGALSEFRQRGVSAMAAPGREEATDMAMEAGIEIYDLISGASDEKIQSAIRDADNDIREFLKIMGVKGF